MKSSLPQSSKKSSGTQKSNRSSTSTTQLQDKRKLSQDQQHLINLANTCKTAVQLKAFGQLLNGNAPFQKMNLEEEEPLQGKLETIQKQGSEEEELMQGKFKTFQKMGIEEEEPLLGKFETIQKQENNTGLPDNLKSGIENLSGYSMDDVKVHYNSDKPAALQAHAYAQGTDNHIASGQEKHLTHEAWHVVQQKQGRVKPTIQLQGKVNVNDDKGLEKEADVMGGRAIQLKASSSPIQLMPWNNIAPVNGKKIPDLIEDSKQFGGHAGENHIYIGWSGLMERKIPDASAFGDENQAYQVIAEIIQENQQEIENHIESTPNTNGKFVFKKSISDLKVLSYSQVISSGKGKPEGSIGGEVVLVLKYRFINNIGEVILTTAYPIALDSSEFFNKKKGKHKYEKHREASINYGKGAQKSFDKYLDSI